MLIADQLDQVVRRLTVIRGVVRGMGATWPIEEQLLEAVAQIAVVRVTLERLHNDRDPLGAARGVLNGLALVLPLYAAAGFLWLRRLLSGLE
jgi:hypothetical protein